MTGGYLSQAATLASEQVARGVSADGGVLMHGPTFMANPLACAASCASIDLLLEGPWERRVADLEAQLITELTPFRDHPRVQDVRVFGAIGVVQTDRPVPVAKLQQSFVASGVWIRPFRDLIYVMPPYIVQPKELSRLTLSIGTALEQL